MIGMNKFQTLFQVCKTKKHLNQLHAHLTTTGLIHYLPLASKLVTSFASTPLVARSIALQIDGLDTYTWNSIIKGFLHHSDAPQAFSLYSYLTRKRKPVVLVDSYTLLYLIKACELMPTLSQGKQMHTHVFKLGFASHIIIQTSLLDLYASFDEIFSVPKVFDEMPLRDTVAWNSLIAAYTQLGYPVQAIEAFNDMMMSDDVRPNATTAVSVLCACSSLRDGKAAHGYVVRNVGETIDVFVYNALIGLYSRYGCMLYASRVFRLMPLRNVVSWTSMINGYSDGNDPDKALALLKEMESQCVKPDEVTLLAVVSMCSKLGSSELGEWIHRYSQEKGFSVERNVALANSLVDMHAKCGNIRRANQIFDHIAKKRTLVSWTSIIQGLAMHGYGVLALVRFIQMQREGFRPDGVVFLSILTACSHAGLVEEGRKCFDSMIKDYKLKPWVEHYGCMVDLLCRGRLVNEAFEVIVDMPVKPDMIMWRTLLGACPVHSDITLPSHIMHRLREVQPEDSADFGTLTSVYAGLGQWNVVKEIRERMKVKGVRKLEPGCSVIQESQLVLV